MKQIVIVTEYTSDIGTIYCDEYGVKQLFVNLLRWRRNYCTCSPPALSLYITVANHMGNARLVVCLQRGMCKYLYIQN